jgi:hypothetical protein
MPKTLKGFDAVTTFRNSSKGQACLFYKAAVRLAPFKSASRYRRSVFSLRHLQGEGPRRRRYPHARVCFREIHFPAPGAFRHEIRSPPVPSGTISGRDFRDCRTLERGTALASGGNDTLVLYGNPILSPYAVRFSLPSS